MVRELFSDERAENVEIVQVQISRAKKAGNHYLMRAENPVWICAFTFKGSAVEEDDGGE